ncbi:hypothetical protein PoB_002449300 [Plakobranchus ocellatus]|uniref:Uncharacterized protein n=1 Tax=Plakobranchus ocellatus TaxID=259542 RepID=A0AAV3ZU82_9GAST|nr:hypothetical protein PoB_002449300 [Plakobranchus ocellatus]
MHCSFRYPNLKLCPAQVQTFKRENPKRSSVYKITLLLQQTGQSRQEQPLHLASGVLASHRQSEICSCRWDSYFAGLNSSPLQLPRYREGLRT